MFGRKHDCIFVPHRDGSIVMVEAKRAVHITATESKILDALLTAEPNPLSAEDLYKVLWPSGVLPDDPHNCLRQQLDRLRKALDGTPCRIERRSGWVLVGPMKHERFWSTDDAND